MIEPTACDAIPTTSADDRTNSATTSNDGVNNSVDTNKVRDMASTWCGRTGCSSCGDCKQTRLGQRQSNMWINNMIEPTVCVMQSQQQILIIQPTVCVPTVRVMQSQQQGLMIGPTVCMMPSQQLVRMIEPTVCVMQSQQLVLMIEPTVCVKQSQQLVLMI